MKLKTTLAGSLAVAAAVLAYASLPEKVAPTTLPAARAEAPAATPQLPTTNIISDVAERVMPSVVNISMSKTRKTGAMDPHMNSPLFREFFGGRMPPQAPQRERGAGSGVVISADGFIVTNNHVVQDADQIVVSFADRREYKAKLIGADPPADIALIKIDATGLTPVPIGDSSTLRIGEYVLAIGNPFGVGQTVTMGIVSAKGRANMGILDYEDFIQTDASINPGNSGGALVNLKGELVGIPSAILSPGSMTGGPGASVGIGFAVPSNMFRPILDQIRDHGRVRRGWLGVSIQDITPDLAAGLDLKVTRGVLIGDVMDDGPARGELKAQDVVLSVNGKPTESASQLRNVIAFLGPGTKAKLRVIREGKEKDVSVTLGEKEEKQGKTQQSDQGQLFEGLQLDDLDAQTRREIDAPEKLEGVVVTKVAPDSPASDAGLRPGDVVTSINRKAVTSVRDLRGMSLEKADKVLLRIWRQGYSMFVPLKK